MLIFEIACAAFTAASLSLAGYWMRGTALNNRATTAYLHGDIAAGDELRQRARRWSVGARS